MQLLALVLVGGKSKRMGRSKALLEMNGKTALERVVSVVAPFADRVVLGGSGPVPDSLVELERLDDAPGVEGPLAGILAAIRREPEARWLVLPCDLPLIQPDAVKWLLAQSCAGFDAVFPRLDAGPEYEPLFAIYEPTCRPMLEAGAQLGRFAPREALADARVLKPRVPAEHRAAWTNVNTPEEWKAIDLPCFKRPKE